MRRRKFNRNPTAHFFPETVGQMEDAAIKLFHNMCEAIEINIPNEELFWLITPPDEAKLLIRAGAVAHTIYGRQISSLILPWSDSSAGTKIKVNFRYPHEELLLSRNSAFQPMFSPELTKQIDAWVVHRRSIGEQFGRLMRLINYLVGAYTKNEIRYCFPSILVLLKMNSTTWQMAEDLRQIKSSFDVPYNLRKIIDDATATVSSALLVPERKEYAFISALELQTSIRLTEQPIGMFSVL